MTAQEFAATWLLYGMLLAGLAVLARSRFALFRAQFEAALEAERQTRAARAAADDVDRMLTVMLPASALARLLAGKPVEDATGEASVLFASPSAPKLVPEAAEWLSIRSWSRLEGVEEWSSTLLAGTHAKDRQGLGFVVVVGRHGGLEFLATELARLGHLTSLAGSVQA